MTWKKIYKGIADSVPTYLTVAIDADDTSITVADASVINTGETDGYIILGSGPTEVLKFTAQPVGNVYTVTRGADGRTPSSWPIGTVVSRRYTSKDQQDIIDVATELQGAVDTINGATFKAADADKLDGNDSTYFLPATAVGTAAAKNVAATGDAASTEVVLGSDTRLTDARAPTTHNHDLVYLGITAKASDSDLLDSHDTAYFATADHNHDTAYAPAVSGVTNGDSHNHLGGDGGQIAYTSLSGAPSGVVSSAGTKTTYRSSLTAVDKIVVPTITCAASATAGSLTNVLHYVTIVCKCAYGLTTPATIVSATPIASTSIDVTIPAVTGATSYAVFLSTGTAPLRVAEVTEAQRAAGCAVTAVNTVGAGGSAGVVNVRVVGTGLACTDASYSTNYAYLPDPITSIDTTGKSVSYVWVDFTVTSGTGFVSVTPFLYVGSAWVQGLSETLLLKYPSEHQLVLDLNAATGLKVLVNTISGTGASATISYTLVSQGLV